MYDLACAYAYPRWLQLSSESVGILEPRRNGPHVEVTGKNAKLCLVICQETKDSPVHRTLVALTGGLVQVSRLANGRSHDGGVAP